ncbi:MAG: DNA translocase FtsK 4TM domain-containing protein, partial [Acutalibacteraceae bacterium]
MNTEAIVAVFFHDIMFGLFAKTAYLIPPAIAGLGIYVVKMKSYDRLYIKSIMLFFFISCVAGLIHIMSDKTMPVSELYGYGVAGTGGGFLGGILSMIFVNTIGKTAAVIVLIFAIVTLMSLILKISVVTAVSTFVSGLFGMREEFEVEHPDRYEQGRRVKKKVERIIPEPEKPALTGESLDFEIDNEKPKKKVKKKDISEDTKPEENVIPVSEIENVIFKPEPDEPILSVKREPEPDAAAETDFEPEQQKPAAKEEKAAPITKAERDEIHSEIDGAIVKEVKEYKFPPLKLLKAAPPVSADKRQEMRETAQKLMEVLSDFNVEAKLLQVTQGPSVTRYEIQPETG